MSVDSVKRVWLVLFVKYRNCNDANRQCCHQSFVISTNRYRKTSIFSASIDLLSILTWTSLFSKDEPIKSCLLSCNLIRDIKIQKHISNSSFFILINARLCQALQTPTCTVTALNLRIVSDHRFRCCQSMLNITDTNMSSNHTLTEMGVYTILMLTWIE